ncbi:unnamed protein product, partial [Prorocentrum cordatum]
EDVFTMCAEDAGVFVDCFSYMGVAQAAEECADPVFKEKWDRAKKARAQPDSVDLVKQTVQQSRSYTVKVYRKWTAMSTSECVSIFGKQPLKEDVKNLPTIRIPCDTDPVGPHELVYLFTWEVNSPLRTVEVGFTIDSDAATIAMDVGMQFYAEQTKQQVSDDFDSLVKKDFHTIREFSETADLPLKAVEKACAVANLPVAAVGNSGASSRCSPVQSPGPGCGNILFTPSPDQSRVGESLVSAGSGQPNHVQKVGLQQLGSAGSAAGGKSRAPSLKGIPDDVGDSAGLTGGGEGDDITDSATTYIKKLSLVGAMLLEKQRLSYHRAKGRIEGWEKNPSMEDQSKRLKKHMANWVLAESLNPTNLKDLSKSECEKAFEKLSAIVKIPGAVMCTLWEKSYKQIFTQTGVTSEDEKITTLLAYSWPWNVPALAHEKSCATFEDAFDIKDPRLMFVDAASFDEKMALFKAQFLKGLLCAHISKGGESANAVMRVCITLQEWVTRTMGENAVNDVREINNIDNPVGIAKSIAPSVSDVGFYSDRIQLVMMSAAKFQEAISAGGGHKHEFWGELTEILKMLPTVIFAIPAEFKVQIRADVLGEVKEVAGGDPMQTAGVHAAFASAFGAATTAKGAHEKLSEIEGLVRSNSLQTLPDELVETIVAGLDGLCDAALDVFPDADVDRIGGVVDDACQSLGRDGEPVVQKVMHALVTARSIDTQLKALGAATTGMEQTSEKVEPVLVNTLQFLMGELTEHHSDLCKQDDHKRHVQRLDDVMKQAEGRLQWAGSLTMKNNKLELAG